MRYPQVKQTLRPAGGLLQMRRLPSGRFLHAGVGRRIHWRGEGACGMAVYERGIDVSRYQGLVNWPAVAGAGIQFAMVRIGSSNGGAVYVDP